MGRAVAVKGEGPLFRAGLVVGLPEATGCRKGCAGQSAGAGAPGKQGLGEVDGAGA